MSESYFFAIRALSLRVQHGFAKTIKPNTKYRLVLFKGIQKCDEMKEAVKSKLVGGKIDLSLPILQFNIPYYSPNRSIQFNLKLYETKPNQQQNEIATYKIKSSDIVKTYKNDKNVLQKGEGQFQTDLFLQYEMFIQSSKDSLKQAIQRFSSNQTYNPKSIKNIQTENKSQSSKSRQVVRQGDGFLSPSRRRIQRKRGHESKLRSRGNSRDNSDDEGSVTSSRRKFKKSPPTGKEQHFLHSNKKASPPKVEKTDTKAKSSASKSPGKQSQSNQNAQSNLQANKKTYSYQAPNKLKYKNTAQIFDVQVQKDEKPVGLKPSYSKPNLQIKTQIQQKKIPVYSPKSVAQNKNVPISSKVVQKKKQQIEQTQPVVERKVSPGKFNPVRSPKSGNTAAEQTKNGLNSVISPKTQTSPKFADLQIQHNKQIFDINLKKNTTNQSKSQIGSKNGLNLTSAQNKLQQSSIYISMDGPNAQPQKNKRAPEIISDSNEQDQPIKVNQRPIKRTKSQIEMEPTLKGSVRLGELNHKFGQDKRKKEQQQYRRYSIYYSAFLLVGMFFIYLAMTPTRKV